MESAIRRIQSLTPALAAALVAAGCGSPQGIELPEYLPPDAGERRAIALVDSLTCTVDADCDPDHRCFQSRCAIPPQSAAPTVDVVPGLSLQRLPDREHRVKSGQATVRLSVTLSADVPAQGLAFILERSDEPGAVPVLQYRPGSGREVHFDVPVGQASPDAEAPEAVGLTLRTQAGTVRASLLPELSADGIYEGEAVFPTFGQLGLPLELTVVTEPAGASLESASAAYLVLPVEDGELFSATTPTVDGPAFITRPLSYDAFVGAWVATFELPFTFDPTSPFAWVAGPGNAVSRSLRFELKAGDGQLWGRIADRWSGLFEARSAAGVTEPTDIVFRGELALRRLQAPPPVSSVTPPVAPVPHLPGALPLPAISVCEGVSFAAAGEACAALGNTSGFLAAGAEAQASCALAMADHALAGDTTASQIAAFLDDSIPDPGGQSFASFMRDCAAQAGGTCVPSPEVLCARQLTARTLKVSDGSDGATELALLRAYQSTSREAFLGRQFAAFHSDAQTRLAWLQATDFPAIVTAAVQNHVKGLLTEWEAQVLDAQMGVLRGQFDAAGGAVLGQQLSDPDALDAQRLLLLEISQSWRGSADALALGASRWNTLLTATGERRVQARRVHQRALDLYLVAGLLAELNRQAGAGANNALFAGGFRPVILQARKLALPFDRLAYERQGEVVVSTSLDPTSTNDTVLAERKTQALTELDKADTAVTQVISQANAELLSQAALTGRLSSEISSAGTELAGLCGLPAGCAAPNDGACRVRVEAGQCGFLHSASGELVDAFPADANVSQAGGALLKVQAALLALRRAEDAELAHAAKLELASKTTEAFAAQVNAWNNERIALTGAVREQIRQLRESKDDTVAELGKNLEAQASVRAQRLEAEKEYVERWKEITVEGVDEDIAAMVEIGYYNATAAGLRNAADATNRHAKAATEGMPSAATDPSFAARLSIWMSANYVTDAMKAAAVLADLQAARLTRELTRRKGLREAQLKDLTLSEEVAAHAADAEVEELRNRAAQITTAAELEQNIIREVIRLMERETDAALAYERDLVELRDRRNALHTQLIESSNLSIQTQQASLAVDQAMHDYNQVVQRAQLLEGRLLQLQLQLQNVNTIVGSPSVVFSWANRLTRAEERLARAKDALMDWVVALEYFAVRPFFDQRIQILLASNTTQLEAIANELDRLQRSCGGPVNSQLVELSVRRDLLQITGPQENLHTGATLSPAQRFREVLAAARIPVDKRIRYRQDQTVGDLLNRSGVWAATFSFDMDDFANLGNVCNAKVASISVQLVGEGLGNARPTATLLYDGTSRLRSCQPDIENLVAAIGPESTPFDSVTDLQAKGRSISPLAGINAFGEVSNENRTLGGLPLVSQYTLLIDPAVGENPAINWGALEDVKLRVVYSYQDFFPAGQCQ